MENPAYARATLFQNYLSDENNGKSAGYNKKKLDVPVSYRIATCLDNFKQTYIQYTQNNTHIIIQLRC